MFCDCVYSVEEKGINIFLQLFYFETTIYLEKSSNKNNVQTWPADPCWRVRKSYQLHA